MEEGIQQSLCHWGAAVGRLVRTRNSLRFHHSGA
jgi:hypothetical protein